MFNYELEKDNILNCINNIYLLVKEAKENNTGIIEELNNEYQNDLLNCIDLDDKEGLFHLVTTRIKNLDADSNIKKFIVYEIGSDEYSNIFDNYDEIKLKMKIEKNLKGF